MTKFLWYNHGSLSIYIITKGEKNKHLEIVNDMRDVELIISKKKKKTNTFLKGCFRMFCPDLGRSNPS